MTWVDSLLGIVVGGGILFAVIVLSGGGMGGGDMKLGAMMGAFLGYKLALVALFVAVILGGIVAVTLLSTGIRGRKDPVPLAHSLRWAPPFCSGAFLGWYFSAFSRAVWPTWFQRRRAHGRHGNRWHHERRFRPVDDHLLAVRDARGRHPELAAALSRAPPDRGHPEREHCVRSSPTDTAWLNACGGTRWRDREPTLRASGATNNIRVIRTGIGLRLLSVPPTGATFTVTKPAGRRDANVVVAASDASDPVAVQTLKALDTAA